ncbi:hypothetical protein GCM10025882_31510 [Acinetobacter gyllenbergii]|uniref:Uncharacterized protein n=1 Tax=Acinetobacter gyllenbergii CIP 110306 = MTCC 11365 TaxID=1217657 RepID=A0A829HI69_9GAMM|nr:hypothetical protein [Acinetobacter gyllenbergii]EPF81519.1 hypothetical protein F957_02060 [Acinetobacter gyllenbergii CIP 110306 = MTCC 11365]EPH31051.1 hypothetical protein L293_2454 [Acinetobacter gyllenbergii CIP 110306 = MTCC 11365]GMA12726.1 hypothetical protein GCM10025882_31510 [Acinetobacter gyllenbergii]
MRALLILSGIVFAILLYASVKFGFDLKTALFTFVSLIIFAAGAYFLYPSFAGAVFPKPLFYIVAGVLFSFCFYPILEFYSLKPDGYDWLDWAGINDKHFRLGFVEQAWYGKWYGKLGFSVLCALIALIVQQLFDNDD